MNVYCFGYNSRGHFHAHLMLLSCFSSLAVNLSFLVDHWVLSAFWRQLQNPAWTGYWELLPVTPSTKDSVGVLSRVWAYWSIVLGDKRENSDFIYFLAGKHFAESGNDSFCRPHRCYNSCKYGRWGWLIPFWCVFQDSIIFIFQQLKYTYAELCVSLLMFLYLCKKEKTCYALKAFTLVCFLHYLLSRPPLSYNDRTS